MSDPRLLGPPHVQRRLADLRDQPLNFDPTSLRDASPAGGWITTDLCQELPTEPPGDPVPGGSWEIARRLMSGYEFADPSIVRAYYDSDQPLRERNMLLKLQAPRAAHLYVGVRVGEVYERDATLDGSAVRIWGWNYRTLEGHVEMGQMDWEVWKWLDAGRVEFRVHAVARTARIGNPIIWLGFHLLRGRERRAFLESTKRRMLKFTKLALEAERPSALVRDAAKEEIARGRADLEEVHETLARRLDSV